MFYYKTYSMASVYVLFHCSSLSSCYFVKITSFLASLEARNSYSLLAPNILEPCIKSSTALLFINVQDVPPRTTTLIPPFPIIQHRTERKIRVTNHLSPFLKEMTDPRFDSSLTTISNVSSIFPPRTLSQLHFTPS